MDLSKFSLSLNKKIIKYCQDIKHRLRNKESGNQKRKLTETLHQRGTSSGRPESIKQLSKIHQ
jgi:hypothetical protein